MAQVRVKLNPKDHLAGLNQELTLETTDRAGVKHEWSGYVISWSPTGENVRLRFTPTGIEGSYEARDFCVVTEVTAPEGWRREPRSLETIEALFNVLLQAVRALRANDVVVQVDSGPGCPRVVRLEEGVQVSIADEAHGRRHLRTVTL